MTTSVRSRGAARRFLEARAALTEREQVAVGDLPSDAATLLRLLGHLGEAPIPLARLAPAFDDACRRLGRPHPDDDALVRCRDLLNKRSLVEVRSAGVFVLPTLAAYQRAAARAGGQRWWPAQVRRLVHEWVGDEELPWSSRVVHAMSALAEADVADVEDAQVGCQLVLWVDGALTEPEDTLPLEAMDFPRVAAAWNGVASVHAVAAAEQIDAALRRAEQDAEAVRLPELDLLNPRRARLSPAAVLLFWAVVLGSLWVLFAGG